MVTGLIKNQVSANTNLPHTDEATEIRAHSSDGITKMLSTLRKAQAQAPSPHRMIPAAKDL